MGLALRFSALSINGRVEDAKTALSDSAKEFLWMEFHLPWVIAEGFSVLDEKGEAMRWLERSVEKGNFNYPVLSELDPLLANLRGDSRFRAVLEWVKRKWDGFKI